MTNVQLTREDLVANHLKKTEEQTLAEGGDVLVCVAEFAEDLANFNEAMARYVRDKGETDRNDLIRRWAEVQYSLSMFSWFFEFDGQAAFNRLMDGDYDMEGL